MFPQACAMRDPSALRGIIRAPVLYPLTRGNNGGFQMAGGISNMFLLRAATRPVGRPAFLMRTDASIENDRWYLAAVLFNVCQTPGNKRSVDTILASMETTVTIHRFRDTLTIFGFRVVSLDHGYIPTPAAAFRVCRHRICR